MGLARTVAAVLGVVYLIVGIVGFIPAFGFGSVPADMADVTTINLLGLFPVNPVHNVVHLVIGAALLYGSTATATAILVSRVVGAVYVLVGLLGFVAPAGFGLLPLGGLDIALHLGTGAVLLALGFLATTSEMRTA